jgi:predicted nucleotidyltransferase
MITAMKKKPTLTRARILKVLREHEDLLRRYSVKRLGLFGSYARGQQKRGSDVDFLVDFEKPTYDNFIDLTFSLERLFRRKVGLVTSRSLNPHVKPFVENEVAWHEVR